MEVMKEDMDMEVVIKKKVKQQKNKKREEKI